MDARIDAFSMTPGEWTNALSSMGEKKFLGKSIFRWIHQHHVFSYDAMSDLSKGLREKLKEAFPLTPAAVSTIQRAEDGTAKLLIRLDDGYFIECVLMKYRFGYSLCISSQAGCRMGCRFCASTLNGLDRSLTAGEMAQQIYLTEEELKVKVSHVVIMGCGEPFDNYDQLLRFLELIHDEDGQFLSLRNITVSTCGLPEKIVAFAKTDLPVTLAVSLHAPNDEVRKKIMNIARAVPMEKLMASCREYTRITNRRITFEYLLINELNDSQEQAKELSELLKGMLCHVNVIPVNPVKECGFDRPAEGRIVSFIETLEKNHIPVTRRREMGKKIDAACGQLRHRATAGDDLV